MQVRHGQEAAAGIDADSLAEAPFPRPGEPRTPREPEPAGLRAPKAKRVEDEPVVRHQAQLSAQQDRVRLSGERGAQHPVVELGDGAAEPGATGERTRGDDSERAHAAPVSEPRKRPGRNLLQAEHIRVVGAREPHHLREERAPLRRHRVAVEDVPGTDQHGALL